MAPYDFATIYNVLPLWNAASPIDGTGQTIAIVGQSDIYSQDFSDFRQDFGLPPGKLNIIDNGPAPDRLASQGDELESDLDVEWSGAVAKGATIDLVASTTTNTTAGVDLSALYIVDNNLAPVMSESYGACELDMGTAGNQFYNQLWQQAAAQGTPRALCLSVMFLATGSLISWSAGYTPVAPSTFRARSINYQSNGTFATKGAAPTYPTVLVDLNGDGIPDMVGFTGEEILIWKGDGTGIFGAPFNQISLPRGFSQYYFRDMDKDGHMDIVLPGVILYGDGNFNFTAVTWDFYENFAVGDFDGDGLPDIATGSGILFGQGNRTFTAAMGSSPLPNSAPPFPTQVVADINGDGKDDLVLADSGPAIYLSMGRQGFELDQELIVQAYAPVISSAAIADFNGDGLLDIAVGLLSPEEALIFTNDGTGKYQLTSYATGVGSLASIAADLSHDGKPDLATLDYYTYVPPTVTVLLHK